MLYYFYGRPDKLYWFGEFMAELRKRSKKHIGVLEFFEKPKKKKNKHK